MKEYEENKAQNEEEDEMVNVVTLNDEDGNEQDFEYIDSVEYEGKEYGFFLPMEEDASELVILQIEPSEENEDEEVFIGIDDEELLKKVFAIFKEKYQDEFDFEEEEEESEHLAPCCAELHTAGRSVFLSEVR